MFLVPMILQIIVVNEHIPTGDIVCYEQTMDDSRITSKLENPKIAKDFHLFLRTELNIHGILITGVGNGHGESRSGISLSVDTIGKDMYPTIFPPTMGK